MPPIPAGSRYVAMGSSFAAGPGIAPRAPASPRRAGRSAGNYARLVARALGLDLHDVTFSGATTGDILRVSAAGPPSAGGRHAGHAPGHDHRERQRCRLPARLTLASLLWPLRALPQVKARVAGFRDRDATDERFGQLEDNQAMIGGRLRDRAPAARCSFC